MILTYTSKPYSGSPTKVGIIRMYPHHPTDVVAHKPRISILPQIDNERALVQSYLDCDGCYRWVISQYIPSYVSYWSFISHLRLCEVYTIYTYFVPIKHSYCQNMQMWCTWNVFMFDKKEMHACTGPLDHFNPKRDVLLTIQNVDYIILTS